MSHSQDWNKAVNIPRLMQELGAVGVSGLVDYARTSENATTLWIQDGITAQQQSDIEAVVDAHSATPLPPGPLLLDVRPEISGIPMVARQDIGSGVFGTVGVVIGEDNSIQIDVDPAKTESVLTLSGVAKLTKSDDVPFASTTSTAFVNIATLTASVPTSGIYRAQWSFQGSCSQANKRCNFRIRVDDSTLISDLMDIDTSFNVTDGRLQFGGFAQFGLDAGIHMIDFDHRFADTGGGAVQTENLRIELLRVS